MTEPIVKSTASIIIAIIVLALCACYLSGCTTLSTAITVPTDYGTAIIRTHGGKTSVDLELPRR